MTARLCLPNLADLIDRLTIDQIKEVELRDRAAAFAEDMERVGHDLDAIFAERKVALTADLVRVVTALAQLNVFIWRLKDDMQACLPDRPDEYDRLLKRAHQLNGVRNRLKNLLLEVSGDRDPAERRTNVETDGLEGWDISILARFGRPRSTP